MGFLSAAEEHEQQGCQCADQSARCMHTSLWLQVRKFARLDIDPASITWRRVIDTNDRWVSHWQEDEQYMRHQSRASPCQGNLQQQERVQRGSKAQRREA
jgi:hypothetical protein